METGQNFMTEVGIKGHGLGRADFIVGGKLGGRRTDGIHEPRTHQHASPDAPRQMLDINIAQPVEYVSLAFMPGIEQAEIGVNSS